MLCQFEFQQSTHQLAGLAPALLDQALQIDRVMAHEPEHVGVCRGFDRRLINAASTAGGGADFLQHVLRTLDELGTVADQPMATF